MELELLETKYGVQCEDGSTIGHIRTYDGGNWYYYANDDSINHTAEELIFISNQLDRLNNPDDKDHVIARVKVSMN